VFPCLIRRGYVRDNPLIRPIGDLKTLDAVKPEGEDLKRARYLVYTTK